MIHRMIKTWPLLIAVMVTGCGDNSTCPVGDSVVGATQTRERGNKAYAEGLKDLDEGRYERAVEAFSQAAKDIPKNYGVYVNRANAYDMLKQYDKALAVYNFVLSEASKDQRLAEVYYNRGYMYQRSGNNANAIADYEEALRLDPKIPDARERLDSLQQAQTEKPIADQSEMPSKP